MRSLVNDIPPPRQSASARSVELPVWIGFAVVTAFFAISAYLTTDAMRRLRASSDLVVHTHEVLAGLERVASLVTEAETGQRGYVITGDERYLGSYAGALANMEATIGDLERRTADNASQQARLPALREIAAARRAELEAVLELRRDVGLEAARERILTDRGRALMASLRAQVDTMTAEEKDLLAARLGERSEAFGVAVRSVLVSALFGTVLAGVVTVLIRRAARARLQAAWLRTGQAAVADGLIGVERAEALGERALRTLCEHMGAQAGVFYVKEEGRFRRCAVYALAADGAAPEFVAEGEGLLGQAVKDGRPFVLRDVPAESLRIETSLANARPKHLLVAPAVFEGRAMAAMEFAFFDRVPPAALELLAESAEAIGGAVSAARSRTRIVELLEETQRQSEELQAQSEELRVTNEELEEQARALQVSQQRLEQQQSELEAHNALLEEQTQQLEMQKTELTGAKDDLERQARLVEQASRYKSDFLANMSHELRTPLNSSLILAQLLAENRTGNLTDDQVKYARTIQSSGNDLLALINDVLDLSKIEAGRMDVHPEPVETGEFLESLRAKFDPLTKAKGLALRFETAAGAPGVIDTDRQRLEQVLRNLLSNAIKFTPHGEVALRVSQRDGDRVAFAVQDTGIGIDPAQQRIVFEPFCQADGTTNRQYGGTGLGLSISRELTRLLGGEIHLASEPGKGSVFTVVLPVRIGSAPPPVARQTQAASAPAAPAAARPAVADDRERIAPTARVILIVEDDHTYAEVLANLAREQNFQCLVATTGEEALALAREHVPSAVLLDIVLPDGSGLAVLQRLKDDARTRHIPVHVVSGSDYAEKALALGAVGYMLKPVARERLVEAMKALEDRLTRRLRRVLVVEDDDVQREALCDLLGSREVEAVGAGRAADCLEKLAHATFDCMVLDLSLPDASGFSLLERISEDEAYPFPPVIIYTGRDLTADEEQRLRRYSNAIIIKGAKSPERLLDEVALFLHQVVADMPPEQRRMIELARSRDAALEGRRVLLVEDDVRNIFALTSVFEPLGVTLEIARNGREALEALRRIGEGQAQPVDLVLMDIMMPEMDGLTAMREIRRRREWAKLPIIALTAKAMPNDQQQCLEAGANDYLAKPLDVERLLSLVRVWMPR